jgi:hypothetical protein
MEEFSRHWASHRPRADIEQMYRKQPPNPRATNARFMLSISAVLA